MRTKFLLGIFLITALLVGGCASSPDSQMVNEQLAQILTQSALAQPSATAPLPTVTATEVTPPPPTPPPAGGALTATPDATLKITSITETAPGRAVVNWEAVGNFPAGFTIVWTTETRKPLYPGDDAIFAGDPNARSAMMSGLTGKVYIVSVCRTSVSGCDVYSDPAFFVFTNYAPTPTIMDANRIDENRVCQHWRRGRGWRRWRGYCHTHARGEVCHSQHHRRWKPESAHDLDLGRQP